MDFPTKIKRYAPYIQAALEQKRTLPLTPAALEVLTIAAYHQPVTKRFIAHVRGIDSSTLVNTLVERGLLEEGERLDLPGKPIAYRTTRNPGLKLSDRRLFSCLHQLVRF